MQRMVPLLILHNIIHFVCHNTYQFPCQPIKVNFLKQQQIYNKYNIYCTRLSNKYLLD